MIVLGCICAVLALGVFTYVGWFLGKKVRQQLYPLLVRFFALVFGTAVFCMLASLVASPIVNLIWSIAPVVMPDVIGGLELVFAPVYIIGSIGSALANLEETLALWGLLTLVFFGMMGWQLIKRMPNAGDAT